MQIQQLQQNKNTLWELKLVVKMFWLNSLLMLSDDEIL